MGKIKNFNDKIKEVIVYFVGKWAFPVAAFYFTTNNAEVGVLSWFRIPEDGALLSYKSVAAMITVLKAAAPYLLLIIGILWFLTTLPHIKQDVIKIWRGESAETKESNEKEKQMQGGNLAT